MTNPTPWAIRMADTIMQQAPIRAQKWNYEWGVLLRGIEQIALLTGEPRFADYIRHNIDAFVAPDGTIRTYRATDYNIDMINTGRLLFGLLRTTGDARYRQAADTLRDQLRTHPRTPEGGFWHKNIYSQQMWLDGIYMGAPFYTEYAATLEEPDAARHAFDDIAHQITLIDAHARDPHTGLLYHGWDSARQQPWADPQTGCSPHFWGRAVGWFMMALVDVLDHFPADHPQRGRIVAILQQTADALARVQDAASGLWFQVLDQGARPGNYLESSASAMNAYALAKAARLGHLAPEWRDVAARAFQGLIEHKLRVDEQGCVELHDICYVAGLGGVPYRSGTFDYYITEPIVVNDDKGVGPFILAGVELELRGAE